MSKILVIVVMNSIDFIGFVSCNIHNHFTWDTRINHVDYK